MDNHVKDGDHHKVTYFSKFYYCAKLLSQCVVSKISIYSL